MGPNTPRDERVSPSPTDHLRNKLKLYKNSTRFDELPLVSTSSAEGGTPTRARALFPASTPSLHTESCAFCNLIQSGMSYSDELLHPRKGHGNPKITPDCYED